MRLAVLIASVAPGSRAQKKRIAAGDKLISINGHPITDVLDYRFYLNEEKLRLTLETAAGKSRRVRISKQAMEDIGLEFETYLMDSQRCCKNKCVFCFIDQLPKGLRESLYFKDDDSRLSFLFGNYITMTNLDESEIDRIIAMHISPVNVSVHTMNPRLRVEMMKNPNAASSLKYLEKLAKAGIRLNTQLVLCPGINDGRELEFSLNELEKLMPALQSIAAVPVGLTCHREGLPALSEYTAQQAAQVIDTVAAFNRRLSESGTAPIAYAADEFFLKAGREIPQAEYYGDYPQLENGVGMWSLLREEFMQALSEHEHILEKPRCVTCVTGEAAYPLISSLAAAAGNAIEGLEVRVIKAENRLFGRSVTVAGLLCGADLAAAVEGKALGERLLIPAAALRREGDVFLDDMTLEELEIKAGVRVIPVMNDGYALLEEMTG